MSKEIAICPFCKLPSIGKEIRGSWVCGNIKCLAETFSESKVRTLKSVSKVTRGKPAIWSIKDVVK